jgi:hypothetical protein
MVADAATAFRAGENLFPPADSGGEVLGNPPRIQMPGCQGGKQGDVAMAAKVVSEYRGFRLETRATVCGDRYSASYRLESLDDATRIEGYCEGSFVGELSAHGTAHREASRLIDSLVDDAERGDSP